MKRFATRLNSFLLLTLSLMLFSCPAHAAHTVGLSWTAPAADPLGGITITGYKVYRSTASGAEGTTAYATVSGATTLSYTDSAVTGGVDYFYTVTATGTCNPAIYNCSAFVAESGPSNEATTGTIPLPTAPAIGAPTAATAVVH